MYIYNYNCLDLNHAQSFFPASKIHGLRPRTFTAFSQHSFHPSSVALGFSYSQELGKQVTHTGENFSHDKSSNKILSV